jgi:hypothetical protein
MQIFVMPASIRFAGMPRVFCSRQDAKNAKSGIVSSFAAFAPLREAFRLSVAALPR